MLDDVINRLIEGRFTSGMLIARQSLLAIRELADWHEDVAIFDLNRPWFHESKSRSFVTFSSRKFQIRSQTLMNISGAYGARTRNLCRDRAAL